MTLTKVNICVRMRPSLKIFWTLKGINFCSRAIPNLSNKSLNLTPFSRRMRFVSNNYFNISKLSRVLNLGNRTLSSRDQAILNLGQELKVVLIKPRGRMRKIFRRLRLKKMKLN